MATFFGGGNPVNTAPSFVVSINGETGVVTIDVSSIVESIVDSEIIALQSQLQSSIQASQDFAIQRANHTGTQTASTVLFGTGETLESQKVPFLAQGTGPSPSAPSLDTVPTISGTLTVGSTLTATTGTVTNGLGAGHTIIWQWLRVDLTNGEVAISGATNSTYVLTSNDNGLRMAVKQTVRDSVYGLIGNTRTSALSNAVGGTVPANTALPTLSPTGTHVAGTQEYTVGGNTWSGTPTNYNYSFRIDGTQVGSSVNSASNTVNYTPNASGPFGALTVSVAASNANGTGTPAVSTSSITVSAPSAPTDGYTEMTSALWDEVEAEALVTGDTNAANYRSRVAAMSTAGLTVVAPGGSISSAMAASSVGVLLQNGNYTISSQLLLGSKKLLVQDGARAVVDISGITGNGIIGANGTNPQIGAAGTGILEFAAGTGSGCGGVIFYGATDGIMRHVVMTGSLNNSGPAGIAAQNHSVRCIIVSCAAKNVGAGGNADGISMRYNTSRVINEVTVPAENAAIGCYTYRCTDDGYDTWDSGASQHYYFCTAEEAGKKAGTTNGNGNGFKGGIGSAVNHYYKCATINNLSYGWNRNSNTQAPRLKTCTQTSDDAGAFAGGSGLYTIVA